jgi:NedA-like, galactose-binding domain
MEVLHVSICKKVGFAASLVAGLFCVAHPVSAQNGAQGSGQDIVVDTSHAVNSFSPLRALGGAVDRQRGGTTEEEVAKHTDWVLSHPVLKELLAAGWGTITYRQNTELQIQAWHWNPSGTWSNPAEKDGYFVGSAEPTSEPIEHSWSYPLPYRGNTLGDGYAWSRLTDGNPNSYWKSNPYLTKTFTGEDDSLHPQWVMIDLGATENVNAIKIAWANPYARHYYVQYWTGNVEPFYEGINKGAWETFPMGTIKNGHGGTPTLKLISWNIPVRYLRIWMTGSSNTCDTHGSGDKRNCVGYAINEVYVGTLSPGGQFTDVVKHLPSRQQTVTWASSVDPWHSASDIEYKPGDQIGFDLFFHSGVTRGLPAIVPIAILYSTPQDAANEIAYLYKRKYPIAMIEMGEEADGQRILPEDYAALYIQFARAIHKLVPQARLGGPSFEGTPGDVGSWVNANGRASFLGRFVAYLKAHNDLQDFTFFSFEHYPCMDTGLCRDWSSLDMEPEFVDHVVQAWKDNGLPPNIPFFMTEGNDLGEGSPGTVKSGLWLADYVGAMMTAGASGTYYFQDIARPGRSGFDLLSIDQNGHATYGPQYFASQVITQQWAEPVDATHQLYKVASDVKDQEGRDLVTAYAVHRPDGLWSIMLVNNDEYNHHFVRVRFDDPVTRQTQFFTGTVDRVVFGAAQYQWHPDAVPPAAAQPSGTAGDSDGHQRFRFSGHADPDGPAAMSTVAAAGPDSLYDLPRASIVVLRGRIASN